MSTHSSDPSRSAELFARAQHVLPGGVSRNTVLREPHPAYADSGAGCRVTDLDGITRIDFSNNMASLIHGHAYPRLLRRSANNCAVVQASCWPPNAKWPTRNICAPAARASKKFGS